MQNPTTCHSLNLFYLVQVSISCLVFAIPCFYPCLLPLFSTQQSSGLFRIKNRWTMTFLCPEPSNGFHVIQNKSQSLYRCLRALYIVVFATCPTSFSSTIPPRSLSPATVIFLLFPENTKYLTKYFSSDALPLVPMLRMFSSQIAACLAQSLS